MRYCSIEGCGRPHNAHGLCQMHESRQRRGLPMTPETIVRGRLPFALNYQVTSSGCWQWIGAVTTSGYGTYRQQYAHRFSYELHIGPIPEGEQVDHLCRNPLCVNPEHLEAVTPVVNNHRSYAPGAVAVRTNRCKRNHEFTPDNTYSRPDGKGRQCRECTRIRARRHAAQI